MNTFVSMKHEIFKMNLNQLKKHKEREKLIVSILKNKELKLKCMLLEKKLRNEDLNLSQKKYKISPKFSDLLLPISVLILYIIYFCQEFLS